MRTIARRARHPSRIGIDVAPDEGVAGDAGGNGALKEHAVAASRIEDAPLTTAPAERHRTAPPESATPVWSEPAREDLFDLGEDPGEHASRVTTAPAELAELRVVLANLRARSPEFEIRPPARRPSVSREEAERLKALGYH